MKTRNVYWRIFSGALALLTSITLFSCGGGGDSGGSGGGAAPNSSTAFTSFSINGSPGTVDNTAKSIAISLPFGTSVTGLISTFSTNGSTVKVGGVAQVSGVTSNNFTNPLTYTVTAVDGTTTSYTVIVTVSSATAKAMNSFALNGVVGTINAATNTIGVVLPSGTAVTGLIATFSTTGSTVTAGGVAQVSGATSNNFTNPVAYVVTAADGSNATYSIIVTVSSSTANAMSSYSLGGVTGTINNSTKTIGVVLSSGTAVSGLIATFSTTGSIVKVGGVAQVSGVTSNNFTNPVAYEVIAEDGSSATYSVTATVASASAKAITAFSLLGVVGTINAATNTIGVVLPSGTSVTGLIATFSTTGSSVAVGSVTQVSGATSNNFTNPVTYVVTAADNSTATFTVTVTVTASTAKEMTAYSLLGFAGTINEATKTIGVVLPSGTAVTGLIATFSTTGSIVKVGSVAQVSGATSNNFTNPVAYVISAADGSSATYTVIATVVPASAKAMTAFSLLGVTGTINEATKTIGVVLPSGRAVTGLIATFSTTGSTVTAGGVAQVSGATSNNFTNPVAYVVTAADGSTASYTVTVTVAAATSKAITGFSINGVAGTINEATKTIGVALPSGTTLTGLIATFSSTGSGVAIGSVAQVSGVTSNNFISPVTYVVTAADSSTASYTVTATLAPATAKAITAFSLNNVAGSINEVNKTIGVMMPSGTAVTGLIAAFTTTGSSVAVGSVTQVSGATSNNFTNPVAYIVSAADSSTATYTVTVTVGAGPAPVLLGTAGNYVLFSNAGMSSSPDSTITGDVGVGPGVTSTAITTGFTLTQVGAYATAPQVTGKVYAFNYDAPTPSYINSSSTDMGLAYDDARGRLNPDFTNLGGANLAGLILSPGLYKWSSSINLAVNTTLTLNGGPNDVWILQVAGGLTTGANTNISLTGGAVPENVFWQLDTGLTIGATSSFSGVVLAGSAVTVGAGSTINGRLLAKTAITMDSNRITKPAH